MDWHFISCSAPSTPPNYWLEFFKVLPTAFIALIVARITYNQYLVAKAKLKLDLFERRYQIFLQTWAILTKTAKEGASVSADGLHTPFNNFLPEAEFLFGKAIREYLEELAKQWTLLKGYEHSTGVPNVADKINELGQWFLEEASTGAKSQFGKYLAFEEWN